MTIIEKTGIVKHMDFFDLIQQRRSCHHFTPGKKLPREDLLKIVECAGLSPSGYNAQPWEFLIVEGEENLQALSEIAFDQSHIKDASAAILVLADVEIGRNVEEILQDWLRLGYCTEEELPAYRNSIAKKRSPEQREKMALRNATLAAMTLIFAAENLGYGTCPMMGLSPHKLEQHFQIPSDRKLALLVLIGFPEREKELPRLPRKPIDKLIHWNKFNGTN